MDLRRQHTGRLRPARLSVRARLRRVPPAHRGPRRPAGAAGWALLRPGLLDGDADAAARGAPSARDQEMASGVYSDWKGRQGFSDAELAAKARSLRGVLQPQSHEENEVMLRRAGFSQVMQVFRWLLFEGLVARV